MTAKTKKMILTHWSPILTKFIIDPGLHPAKEIAAKSGEGQCAAICFSQFKVFFPNLFFSSDHTIETLSHNIL